MLTTINTRRGRWVGAALGLAVAIGGAGCTPPGPRALLDGERLLQMGRADDAVNRLRSAVEYLPGNAQAWNHLGLALHASRKPGEAAEAYEHALRLDRDLAAAHFNLGCLRLEQGDFGRASDSLRSYVGLQPRSAPGWVRLGQAQLRLRQWDPAAGSFTSALRLQAGDPEALNGLGVSYQYRRRPREAWQCFTNALGRDPRHAPAWLNLAVIAHQAGARPQAVQAYRQFASLRPEAARALGVEAQLRLLEDRPVTAPAIQLPAIGRTNLPALAPAPAPTNRPPPAVSNAAIQRPTPPSASVRPAAGPSTNAAVPAVAPVPAQPRAPPRRAEAGAEGTETNTAVAVSPPPRTEVAPAAAMEAPAAATPPEPATASAPTPAEPEAVAPEVASTQPTAPPPPRDAPLVPVPAPTAGPTPSTPPAEALPEVALEPDPGIAVAVRDEPWNGPLPSATASTNAPNLEAAPRPLVRPVAAQKAVEPVDKRGFWDRANPAKWFESESDAAAEGGGEASLKPGPDATAEASAAEGKTWRWANPASWFRSSPPAKGAVALPPPSTSPAVASRPVEAASPTRPAKEPEVVRVPEAASVPAPPAVRTVAMATPASPATPAPSAELKRYAYRNPPVPDAGDVAAARALVSEGVVEHRRNRLDAAVERYGEALKLDPASFEAQQNLASALLQQGDVQGALVAGESALAIKPDAAPVRLNFALALDRAGYPADAAKEAERVVAGRPDDASAHLLLGNLYSQKLGRADRARDHYLRVIELEPEHPQSVAIRRWLAGRR